MDYEPIFWRVALSSIGDGVILTDETGRVTFMNPVAENLCGWAANEAAGKPLEQVFAIISETSRLRVENPVAKALREKSVVGLTNHTVLIRKDRQETPIDNTAAPILDEAGQVTGAVLVFRDDSQRRRATELHERLAAIIESSDDIIASKDLNGIITSWNRGAERILGYSAEEIVGQHISILVPDDHREDVERILQHIRRGERIDHYETRRRAKDGRIVDVSLTVSPIRDAYGNIIGASKLGRDITEVRRARELRERLAAIVESSEDIIVSKDLNGIITSWNRGAERVLGYKASEIVGRHVSTLMPEDHLEDTVKILGRIRQGQRVESYETKRRAKDGHIVDVSLTVSPIRDAQGNVVGASKVGRDITELRRVRELRERLAAIVESSDDIIISKDLQGFITSWNRGAEQLLGYKAEEVIGRHISMLIPEGYGEDPTKILDLISVGKSVEHYETRRRRKDGTIIDVSLTVSPLRNASGKIIGASKIGRDITERKRTDQLLRQRESELQTLADTIPQLAWMAHPDGHVFWYNRRWYEYTGRQFDELEGTGWQVVHDPEILPQVIERWNQSLRTGTPFEMEFPLRGADGKFRWFLTQTNPLRDENGRIIRWFGTNTDVSEQREQEQALKASEARLRAVVEATPDCVKIVRPDGTLEFMNRTGLCMIEADSSGSIEGKCVYDVIAREHREHWIEQHKKVCAGARLNWDFEIVGLSGGRRWMETHAVPLRLPDGRTGQLAVTRDISDRKQAELEREELLASERAARAEAERANRIKDEFVATLSHELRTPLNAILGWSQVLEVSMQDPQELREGLAAISRNARMQAQLIEDLLDMSRIITGKLRLDVQQINPTGVIEAAIESVLPAVEAKNIRLEKVLASHLGVVSGDPHRLQQVFWNLLTNAVKFTPKGGKVQVTALRVNSHLEISVSDTGCGIEPEFLPYVFERFRQADSSTTRVHGGLGLGLALVKQLTEMHGGSVAVSSPGAGAGATFTVILPLALARVHAKQDQQVITTSTSAADEPGLNLSGIKVLVVDDEADSCMIARRILESRYAEVVAASSADEGMKLFRSTRPNVVISDIGMPGKDGYQFIRDLRALPASEGGQTPAVALTAFARSEDRRRALMAGYQSHVVKPVEPLELVTVVASLIGRTGSY